MAKTQALRRADLKIREDYQALQTEPFPLVLPEPWRTLVAFHGGAETLADKLGIPIFMLVDMARNLVQDHACLDALRAAFVEAGLQVPENLLEQ